MVREVKFINGGLLENGKSKRKKARPGHCDQMDKLYNDHLMDCINCNFPYGIAVKAGYGLQSEVRIKCRGNMGYEAPQVFSVYAIPFVYFIDNRFNQQCQPS